MGIIREITTSKYVSPDTFIESGIYLVKYSDVNIPDLSTMKDEVWYFNKSNNVMILLDMVDSMDLELLNYLKGDVKPIENTKVMVLDQANNSNISEDLFLKAIALARIDTKEIKINNILK